MRCLRTLPHQIGIAQDIVELCPQAILLNYTNPMSMLCWGMYRAAPGIQLVGLCHSVQGTSKEWAKRLDVNLNDVDWLCAGINHQAWFYKFQKMAKTCCRVSENWRSIPKYGAAIPFEWKW